MPSKSSKSSPPTPAVQPQKNALNVANRKKAKYPCPKPAPLDNDLALMQFMGGGSMDRNVKMMMEAQAKAAASSGRPIGVGDVYRDAQGRIWWDQEEEWEYAHLLAGSQPVGACVAGTDWVQFGEESDKENDDRRGSVCTVDSLDARYAIRPTDEQDNLVAFGSRRASHRHGQPIVSSPPRPRYTSKHPHQPQFVLDVAFPHSPTDPKGKYTSAPIDPYAHANHKSRRRPEPLKLAPLSPGPRRPSNSPYDHEKLRRDFLDNSFEPQPAPRSAALPPAPHHSVSHAPGRGKMGFANLRPSFAASMETLTLEKTKSKPSRLNMLFRRKD